MADLLPSARYELASFGELVADASRAGILLSLMDGSARPASELAGIAGVTPRPPAPTCGGSSWAGSSASTRSGGWIVRRKGTRAVRVTSRGAEALLAHFGLRWP